MIENDSAINVHGWFDMCWGAKAKEKEVAKIFLRKYVLNDKECIKGHARELIDIIKKKFGTNCETSTQNGVEVMLPKIQCATKNQANITKTTNATIGNLKKRNQELTEGYEGAAKLAYAIAVEGPKRGVTPWTEDEILILAKDLGVTIKGDCLKAFKAGMPAELVKKDAGARPTTPREESPGDVES